MNQTESHKAGFRHRAESARWRTGSAFLVMRRGIGMLFFCCGLPTLWPVQAWAETEDDYASQVIRCESQNMRMVRCPMDTRGGVDMVRQLSGNACIRNTDWGTDPRGLWVTHGCRAEFAPRRRPSPARAGEESSGRRVIRCESSGGRPQVCNVALRGGEVRLLRQLSGAPCRLDSTWGVDRNAVWVTRGCGGEFEISDENGVFADVERIVRCESRGQRKRVCNTTILHKATLSKQLSTVACVEGRNWGWNGDGVWVDSGCRAEFRVE